MAKPARHPFPENPKKILLFKPGAIGDILWTTPFVRCLRKRHPDAEIVYCVGRWSKDVLVHNPNVDRIVEIDDSRLLRRDILYSLSLSGKLRRERFDVAVNFEKHYLSNLFVWSTGIPVKVGFDRSGEGFPLDLAVPYGKPKHEIQYYLDLLCAMDGEEPFDDAERYVARFGADWYRPEVFPSEEEIRRVEGIFRERRIQGGIVGICPGGGVNTGQRTVFRRWPPDRFVALAGELLGRNRTVVLLGGPSDADAGKGYDERCVNLIGALGIRETVVAMGKCGHVVCNDSGPMNMASAADPRPVIVSLFGPTDPRRKAPLGGNSVPIWKDADIYYPEYDLYGTVRGTEGFLERITVGDVLERIA